MLLLLVDIIASLSTCVSVQSKVFSYSFSFTTELGSFIAIVTCPPRLLFTLYVVSTQCSFTNVYVCACVSACACVCQGVCCRTHQRHRPVFRVIHEARIMGESATDLSI